MGLEGGPAGGDNMEAVALWTGVSPGGVGLVDEEVRGGAMEEAVEEVGGLSCLGFCLWREGCLELGEVVGGTSGPSGRRWVLVLEGSDTEKGIQETSS